MTEIWTELRTTTHSGVHDNLQSFFFFLRERERVSDGLDRQREAHVNIYSLSE